MEKYEIVDTTADIGLKVYGKNIEEFIQNLLEGFYFLCFDKKIECKEGIVEKKNYLIDNLENFVYELLKDLIFYLFTKKNIFKLQKIENSKALFLIFKNVDDIELEIKAITKHNFYVKEKKGFIEGNFIFDV